MTPPRCFNVFLLWAIPCCEAFKVGVLGPVSWYPGSGPMIAALLAAEHFNARNGSIVPAFATSACPDLTIEPVLVDNNATPSETVVAFEYGRRNDWRAIVGPLRSACSVPLAMIGAFFNLLQVSYLSTSPDLDDPSLYPFFSRPVPSDKTVALAIRDYIMTWGWKRIGIINVEDQFGSSYAAAVTQEMTRVGVDIISVSHAYNDNVAIDEALAIIAGGGGSTPPHVILCISFEPDVATMLPLAQARGLIGADYHWIFSQALSSVPAEESLQPLFDGSSRITAAGGLPGDPGFRALTTEWPSLSWSRFKDWLRDGLEAVEAKMPSTTGSIFQSTPASIHAFGYDSMAMIALTACNHGDGTGEYTATELHSTLVSQAFLGATGLVGINELGSRSAATARYTLDNIRYDATTGVSTMHRFVGKYEAVWNFTDTFRFYGGTVNPPGDGTTTGDDDGDETSGKSSTTILERDMTSVIIGVCVSAGLLLLGGALVGYLYKRRVDLAAKFAHARLPDNVQEVITEVFQDVLDNSDGNVANYIPELAVADPGLFAIVLCDLDGNLYCAGDATTPFTIQSTCKPLLYMMAVNEKGLSSVQQKIGEEPSGQPFDALSIDSSNRAYNPYVNAGAIVSASLISASTDEKARFHLFLEVARKMVCEPTRLNLNEQVYASEMATNANNQNITNELARRAIIDSEPNIALATYTRACSMNITTEDVAVMGATLANAGMNPLTGEQVMQSDIVNQTITVMMSCGMYNGAGKWIVDVGIPAKSGVSGSLMCVVPGVCGIGIFSPRLDDNGNSSRGVKVAGLMSKVLGLHVLKAHDNGSTASGPNSPSGSKKNSSNRATSSAASRNRSTSVVPH